MQPRCDNRALTGFDELRIWGSQGHAGAQFALGLAYAEGNGVSQDYAEAAKWYRLAATRRHAGAQLNLGVLFAEGQGVRQDYQEAAKWYRLAAKQGNAGGQFNLGLMYLQGQGVPQDYSKAVKWLRLAAAQGEVHAQFNLGVMYIRGEGVPPDYVQAHMWFNLAAAGGNAHAREGRALAASLLTPGEIAEAQRLARLRQPRKRPSTVQEGCAGQTSQVAFRVGDWSVICDLRQSSCGARSCAATGLR
ncbi:MAG: tetratricopeptide repeat protein [Bryobacteraceae bacterium]